MRLLLSEEPRYSDHLHHLFKTFTIHWPDRNDRILDIGKNKEFHRMDAQIGCASAETKWSISIQRNSEHADF